MVGQIPIAALLIAFPAGCGGDNAPRRVAHPPLATAAAAPSTGHTGLGESAAKGFLRPCQTMIVGSGLVELRCDDYQVVEFRKPESSGRSDADLDDLMAVLRARFGELREHRRDAVIDKLAIRVSDFSAENEKSARGMAVTVSNSAGQYWGFACYKKGTDISKDFCGDAIATAARAGGLAYVDAKKLNDFGTGSLKIPPACESTPGSKIVCPTGQLSWSPEGAGDANTLRAETLARLVEMAGREKVVIEQSELKCKLLGVRASCVRVQLSSKQKDEYLHFVLVTGAGQERLVVCSFPGAAGSSLPVPCDQAIDLNSK
jgi:hypothetical protein